MNIIEEFHQKEIESQNEDDKIVMLCLERELTWYVNNVLRKEEWSDVEWIDCRVIICEVCLQLLYECDSKDSSKEDGSYIFTFDPPTIILKQMFGPQLVLHEAYHHYQFLRGSEFYKQEDISPRLYRETEREARRMEKELYDRHGERMNKHIIDKCGMMWKEKKQMKRRK